MHGSRLDTAAALKTFLALALPGNRRQTWRLVLIAMGFKAHWPSLSLRKDCPVLQSRRGSPLASIDEAMVTIAACEKDRNKKHGMIEAWDVRVEKKQECLCGFRHAVSIDINCSE